jgi:hypothetical protein
MLQNFAMTFRERSAGACLMFAGPGFALASESAHFKQMTGNSFANKACAAGDQNLH